MAQKPSLWDRAAEVTDLPPEALTNVPKLTVTGCRYAVVEYHRGLASYSEDCIEIEGGTMCLRLRGEGLELVAMNRELLILRGQIFSAEFE